MNEHLENIDHPTTPDYAQKGRDLKLGRTELNTPPPADYSPAEIKKITDARLTATEAWSNIENSFNDLAENVSRQAPHYHEPQLPPCEI